MDEWIDLPGKVTVFMTLDANRRYWQIAIDVADKDKTPFASHYGLFRFVGILFGLHNAPDTFQSTMDVILSSVKWKFALDYLHDIVVVSELPQQHIDHLRNVFFLITQRRYHIQIKEVQISFRYH